MKKIKDILIIIVIIIYTVLLIHLCYVTVQSFSNKSQEVTTVFAVTMPEEKELIPTGDFMTYVGDFYVTSYCSCEICCGEYGLGRPRVNNKELVFTAFGYIAEEGITVAVDPSIIPPRTKIYIEGVGVRVAQDVGGAINGYDVDVYYSDHFRATEANLNDRQRKVWIINEEVDLIN